MFDDLGNNNHFAFTNIDNFISKMHIESPINNKKHLVFIVVFVPNKLAFKFNDLYIIIINGANQCWKPVRVFSAQFFSNVYLIHIGIPYLKHQLHGIFQNSLQVFHHSRCWSAIDAPVINSQRQRHYGCDG